MEFLLAWRTDDLLLWWFWVHLFIVFVVTVKYIRRVLWWYSHHLNVLRKSWYCNRVVKQPVRIPIAKLSQINCSHLSNYINFFFFVLWYDFHIFNGISECLKWDDIFVPETVEAPSCWKSELQLRYFHYWVKWLLCRNKSKQSEIIVSFSGAVWSVERKLFYLFVLNIIQNVLIFFLLSFLSNKGSMWTFVWLGYRFHLI